MCSTHDLSAQKALGTCFGQERSDTLPLKSDRPSQQGSESHHHLQAKPHEFHELLTRAQTDGFLAPGDWYGFVSAGRPCDASVEVFDQQVLKLASFLPPIP